VQSRRRDGCDGTENPSQKLASPVLRDLRRTDGRFRRVDAVRGLSFAVRRGEIFGLIGPDGAGKTSIIQTLAGVLRPHAGSASVNGLDVVTRAERVKARVGYMPQGLGSNAYLDHESEIAAWLDRGKAAVVVVIPPDFQRKIDGREQARIQVLTDGALAMQATVAIAYVAAISSRYLIDVLERRAGRATGRGGPTIDERVRVRFNPNMLSAWFAGLLELLNMCTMISLLLTASSLVREKERGTLEQLLVSPARPVEIFLAKITPPVVLALVLSTCSFLFVLIPVFHLPIRGSLVLFYSVTALYVFAMASMGIAIALVARNPPPAIMIMILILQPMIFLSGAWNPPEAMSPWMRWISVVSPLRYYIDFAFGVILKGNGLRAVVWDIAGITVLGSMLFIFSLMWFERSLRAR
jgi:ABC-2 type transport system permease protein